MLLKGNMIPALLLHYLSWWIHEVPLCSLHSKKEREKGRENHDPEKNGGRLVGWVREKYSCLLGSFPLLLLLRYFEINGSGISNSGSDGQIHAGLTPMPCDTKILYSCVLLYYLWDNNKKKEGRIMSRRDKYHLRNFRGNKVIHYPTPEKCIVQYC